MYRIVVILLGILAIVFIMTSYQPTTPLPHIPIPTPTLSYSTYSKTVRNSGND